MEAEGFEEAPESQHGRPVDRCTVLAARQLAGYEIIQNLFDQLYPLGIGIRTLRRVIDAVDQPGNPAFPLQVGISAGDYYEIGADTDETFGFFKGGAVLSVPLAFIPSDYGSWSVSGGASIYAFGTNLKQINEGDTPGVVGTWSLNWTY